jgi:hypothetical protein
MKPTDFLPKTYEEIEDFVGLNFIYREEKDGEIFFKLSAHDLLSSFRDLKDAIGEKNDNGVRAI